jgi:hypothetical protein
MVADPHNFNADPDPAFYFKSLQCGSQLLTLMRIPIQLFFKVMGICDHCSIGPIGLNFVPPGPPRLYFEPLMLLHFFMRIQIQLFTAMRIRIQVFTQMQCCGSGSGIRCLFDPWIRDPE